MKENIKQLRIKLNLSKYAFAKKLNISWNTVHFWEKGIWKPNKTNYAKIKELCKSIYSHYLILKERSSK